VRLSCTDWAEGGWTLEESVAFARLLKDEGVDLVDCSSGGAVPHARIPAGPGYQVPFSACIRAEAGLPTAAVGLIAQGDQAEAIVREGQADMVLLAREFLRDPYWPLRTAKTAEGGKALKPPPQYGRAFA
jgi:2,4-dienoyl-CoA reductase-like NADH-dependent reductase (Old Yellow Enzyme family)